MQQSSSRRRFFGRRKTSSPRLVAVRSVPSPDPDRDLTQLPGRGPAGPSGAVPAGGATYIGRAPVFDRRLDVAGYQLIVDQLGGEVQPADRSRQLLTRALLEVGLDSLIGGRIGFVQLSIEALADNLHHALPAHRMIIEVTGAISRNGEDQLRQARDEGYRLLIGDLELCERPDHAVQIADGACLDLRVGDLSEQMAMVRAWSSRAKVLVDHLADPADVEPCRAAGASWMRGDILRPIERIDEPTVPAHRLAVLELLGELERPDVTVDDIDRLVSVDLGMSYKLLRMANSSYLALERRVERTRDAIVYLGLDTVRAVAALLSLAEASDHPPEIVHMSLLRACHARELLQITEPNLAHAAFTTGLFSSLDLLLGLSIDQVLDRIPVSDAISEALRSRHGRLGRALDVVLAYERNDLAALAESRFEPAEVVMAYRNAVGWVARVTDSLEGRSQAS